MGEGEAGGRWEGEGGGGRGWGWRRVFFWEKKGLEQGEGGFKAFFFEGFVAIWATIGPIAMHKSWVHCGHGDPGR